MRTTTTVSRRAFLTAATAAGGGLLIGAYVPGFLKQVHGQANAFQPNIWLRIAPDDSVTVMLTQIEMGQGVMTAMPMLVAEELDVDWSKVGMEYVGADSAYGNPNMRGRTDNRCQPKCARILEADARGRRGGARHAGNGSCRDLGRR